jgi:hypothetical protein
MGFLGSRVRGLGEGAHGQVLTLSYSSEGYLALAVCRYYYLKIIPGFPYNLLLASYGGMGSLKKS